MSDSKKVQICLQALFWRHILTFSTHRLFLETFSDFLGIIHRFARWNPNCQPRPDKQYFETTFTMIFILLFIIRILFKMVINIDTHPIIKFLFNFLFQQLKQYCNTLLGASKQQRVHSYIGKQSTIYLAEICASNSSYLYFLVTVDKNQNTVNIKQVRSYQMYQQVLL